MAVTRVQARWATPVDSGASISLEFSSEVASGNLAVATCIKYDTADDDFVIGDFSPSGTATTGTPTLDIQETNAGVSVGIFSVPITGNGTLTLQVSGSAGKAYLLGIAEFSGADVGVSRIGGTPIASYGDTTAVDSGNVVSGGAGVFVGVVGTATSESVGHTQDAAFTIIGEEEDGSSHMTGAAATRIVSGDTTDSASWTLSIAYNWVAACAFYKEGVEAPVSAGSIVSTITL